jgi:hypothetical protein
MTQVDNLVTQLRQYETSSSVQPVKCQVELLISALQQLQTGSTGGPFLPLAGTSILTGTQGPIELADGTAASPSIYFENQNGFYYDPVNLGIGFSIGGIQSGYIDSVGSYNFVAGGGLCENVIYGEGGVRQGAIRFSNDTGGASFQCGKGRGSIAAPTVPALGDALGNFDFSGFNGTTATNVTNGARIRGVLTETGTPSATAMGAQMQFFACPIGSATLQTIGTFDTLNGLQLAPPSSSGPSIVAGQANIQGLTTTSPGWYTQLIGDAFQRVRIGLNSTDVASIAFGAGATARDIFLERVGAANLRHGGADGAAPIAQKISVQNVLAGTVDTAGALWSFLDSAGTGAGVSGGFAFNLHPPSATGSTQNVASNAFGIQNNAANTPAMALQAALFTGGTGTTNFPNFLTQPPGATGSTTWSTSGTFHGINSAAGFAGNFLDFHINGGASVFSVSAGGQLIASALNTRSTTSLIIALGNLPNNAAAQLGTLTNAPTAGNPTKWIPINDNGTIRNIPCW